MLCTEWKDGADRCNGVRAWSVNIQEWEGCGWLNPRLTKGVVATPPYGFPRSLLTLKKVTKSI